MDIFAQKGDIVVVHYEVSFNDGTIYDRSKMDAPIKFELGTGYLLPGFEEAILGMRVGDKKKLRLPPEKAFGKKSDELIVTFPKTVVPDHVPCNVGQKAEITHENKKIVVTIIDVTEDTVTLDGNPEPIGKEVILAVELIAIA